MKCRGLLLASATGLFVVAQPANAGDLASDAKAFGTRDTVHSMDISPSGTQLVAVVSTLQSDTEFVQKERAARTLVRPPYSAR